MVIIARQYGLDPNFHTDFGVAWFGARGILGGFDPYPLVGAGLPFNYRWPLVYPAPALVAVTPLALLSEKYAAMAFVGVSTFLLAFGATRRDWHLLPLFGTEAFMNSVRLGQWSIVLTAALFFPWLAVLTAAKPQAGIPILAGSTNRSAIVAAASGGVLLMVAGFILLPGWFPAWMKTIGTLQGIDPPITRFGGVLVLLCLLRWRRPEVWLILTLACMPQTPAWYSTLPLFVIPATLTESVLLAAAAAVGIIFVLTTYFNPESMAELNAFTGSVQIFTIYLPAVALILRRRNQGEPPAWQAGTLK